MRKNKTGGRKYFHQTIKLKDADGNETGKVKTIYHRLREDNRPKR